MVERVAARHDRGTRLDDRRASALRRHEEAAACALPADAAAALRARTQSQPRRVTVLGSTGSVGRNTLDLIEHVPSAFTIEALTAWRNVDDLIEQARRVRPNFVAIADSRLYGRLREGLAGSGIEAGAGREAIIEAAERPADWVMAAIVGATGLAPTLAAIRRGAMIALANKETLVCAGELMMAEIARCRATLLPVDSEHNAIFQVLASDRMEAVDRIVLTASGGPFRRMDRAAMAAVTPEQAVAHPTWDMGAKISVDSATMMNKGLELIEAHHLFDLPGERIDIVVHPQSVVHSLVAYVDGSLLAQLGSPDMRTPIAYTLAWPERMPTTVARLDLARLGELSFEAPDEGRFPALRLAREALEQGAPAPAVMNAANEIAVAAFLEGRIGFLGMHEVVERTLGSVVLPAPVTLDDVLEVDRESRRIAEAATEALVRAGAAAQ